MPLETADITRLVAEGWKAPEVFVAKGRDGKTDMWGLIARPTNFDPNKKYPVIEYIYQGPGDQYVPKTFRPYDWNMTSLAELGFIVVMVDGMGTSFRSRAFENVCYKNRKMPVCRTILLGLRRLHGNILIWMWTGRYLRLFCRWSGIYKCSFALS